MGIAEIIIILSILLIVFVGYKFTKINASKDGSDESMQEQINSIKKDLELVFEHLSYQIEKEKTIKKDEIPETKIEEEEGLHDVVKKVHSMIGMGELKQEIKDFADLLSVNKIREKFGKKPIKQSLHSIFLGGPGTGKTTIARLLGRIYKAAGILPSSKVVEVSRVDLVGKHIGETAIKTNSVIDKAMGGILFIDEAHSLYTDSPSDFGAEAISTIVKRMEDDRGKFAIIIAGYEDDIEEMLKSNQGLKSRFTHKFHFTSYNADELMEIFESFFEDQGFYLDDDAKKELKELMQEEINKENNSFGNGRFARQVFDKAIRNQSKRIKKKIDQSIEIEIDDLEKISKEDIISCKNFVKDKVCK